MRIAHNHHFHQSLVSCTLLPADVCLLSTFDLLDLSFIMGLTMIKWFPHYTNRYSNVVFEFEPTLLSAFFMRNRLCFILTSQWTKWPTRQIPHAMIEIYRWTPASCLLNTHGFKMVKQIFSSDNLMQTFL